MKISHLLLFVLIIFLVASFGVYLIKILEAKVALYRLENFTSQCTTRVEIELANEQYRYYCDVGFYTSPISPEKYQESLISE